MRKGGIAGATLALFALGGCAALSPPKKGAAAIQINEDPYPSTYAPYPGVPTVIRGATIFDGEGGRIDGGTIVLADGAIQAIGGPDLAGAQGGDVDAIAQGDGDGAAVGRLARMPVAGAGGVDDEVEAEPLRLGPQRALGERRATDVAEADEQHRRRHHRRPNSFSRSASLSST